MNKLIIQAADSLRKAIESGNMEVVKSSAYALNKLFEEVVPDPFKDFDAALARFEWASAMIDFFNKVGDTTQAGTLRNRIIAHYQAIRNLKNYTVQQKHELKIRLKEIREKTRFPKRKAIDHKSKEFKRDVFCFKAFDWFAEIHGMLPLESLNYLRPFNIEPFLQSLPLEMPKQQVVEEMTKFCYEKGGNLAPRELQQHYTVDGEPPKHLYVIGNGFDRYHGAESGYMSFRKYLFKQAPEIVGYFDLYFGPRSLDRSFSTPVGWWWCVQPYEYRHDEYGLRYPIATWSRSNLWCDFETNLCELNREKVFDLLDMQLPRVDEGEAGFDYGNYYKPLDEISETVHACTFEMKYHFHKWVNTLHYKKGFKKRMLALDKDALFLNFNYTLFLESEYGIPSGNICYIHGNRKDKYGSLVLGHHAGDRESFDRWVHKNKNRRRYRDVQKDSKGRYFKNDKLADLAFFLKDNKEGNWRLPIRYYAVEAAENRLEKYYEENYKNTTKIIDANMGFFDSLNKVEKVTVIGCSLGGVDMEYYKMIHASVSTGAVWEFSYHNEADWNRIQKFCKELKIDKANVSAFAM